MAYQIKKSNRITEEIEFLGENGEVELTIEIDINVDRIAGGYRKAEMALLETKKKAENGNNKEALDEYGKAIIGFFKLVFGDENTEKMLEYFEGRYTEMLLKTFPFITDVIRPAIAEAVSQYKATAANNYNFSRKQRRKLGIK